MPRALAPSLTLAVRRLTSARLWMQRRLPARAAAPYLAPLPNAAQRCCLADALPAPFHNMPYLACWTDGCCRCRLPCIPARGWDCSSLLPSRLMPCRLPLALARLPTPAFPPLTFYAFAVWWCLVLVVVWLVTLPNAYAGLLAARSTIATPALPVLPTVVDAATYPYFLQQPLLVGWLVPALLPPAPDFFSTCLIRLLGVVD